MSVGETATALAETAATASGHIAFPEQVPDKTRNVGLQFVVGSAIEEFGNPTRYQPVWVIEAKTQYLKCLLSFLFAKER